MKMTEEWRFIGMHAEDLVESTSELPESKQRMKQRLKFSLL